MSGHSKWSQIKRQKGVADARRAAVFTKLGRAIAVAARDGADPAANVKLRLAIDRARASNMPHDIIDRAVQRGSGASADRTLEEVVYEAYGPGGTALLITALTDNRNRTTSELRRVLAEHGSSLVTAGSVAWQFRTSGLLRLNREQPAALSEALELSLIDAGALDVSRGPDGTTITAPPGRLEAVRRILTEHAVPVAEAELTAVPTASVALDSDAAQTLAALRTALEELDDVQAIATNARPSP